MSPTGGLPDDAWASVAEAAEALGLDRRAVSDHAIRVGGDELPPRLSDLVLALGCARGHALAIRRFEAEILPETRRALRRMHGDAAFVDEVQQRVRTHLLVAQPPAAPRIETYAGRGPLAGWVTVTAVRTGMTLLRELARADRFGDARWAATLALPATGDEELEYLKQQYCEAFEEALVQAARALPERERSLLKLSFAEGLSIDRIGTIYGVHRATVARWIVKAKDDLLAGTHAILQRDQGIPRSELASLQRLVRSQLEASLGGLFS